MSTTLPHHTRARARRRSRAAAASAAVALGAFAPGIAAADPGSLPAAAPGELIVRFAPNADGADRAELRDSVGADLEETLPVSGLQLLALEPGRSVEEAAAQLERSDEVSFAEPNFYRRAAATPNDPSFSRLWAFHNTGQEGGTSDADIDAPEAWDLNTGAASVPVAVVDTGVAYDHADLRSNIWANPGEKGSGREANGRDDDGNGLIDDRRGWDWIDDDNTPIDANGHGTHVAGTLAASGNNGVGTTGVNWRGAVMPLRVLDAQGNGTVSDLISAYRYAAARGAKVVNASLGGASFSQAEVDAITSAPQTLFVVAAGNGGADGIGDDVDRTPQYPCNLPASNIVCVAATDRRDALAGSSNYGLTNVDLAAPGVSIYSTLTVGYGLYSGTSMATPHVAGVSALAWARKPAATLTEVKSALLGGAETKASLAGKVLAQGRLNAFRTLALTLPIPQTEGRPSIPSVGDPTPRPKPKPKPKPGSNPPRSAPSPDRAPPRASFQTPSKQRLRKGLAIRVSCSELCTFRLKLTLDRKTARKLRISGSRKAVVVGRASGLLRDAGRSTVFIKLTRKAKKKLAKAKRVRLTLLGQVADGAGNTLTIKRRIRLKR